MVESANNWFETTDMNQWYAYCWRYARNDLQVPVELVIYRWHSWTGEQQARFASAFGNSRRNVLDDNDERLLKFLIENGNSRVWRSMARAATLQRDRRRARDFLTFRVTEGIRPLGNYYQALAVLADPETIPILREALARHRESLSRAPRMGTENRSEHEEYLFRSAYQDYLSCCATLFVRVKVCNVNNAASVKINTPIKKKD